LLLIQDLRTYCGGIVVATGGSRTGRVVAAGIVAVVVVVGRSGRHVVTHGLEHVGIGVRIELTGLSLRLLLHLHDILHHAQKRVEVLLRRPLLLLLLRGRRR